MIIVELTGGLGNQMFQYAYGRSLSVRNRQSLKYYFVNHYGDTQRQYGLGVFNLYGKKINGLLPALIQIPAGYLHIRLPFIVSGYWQSPEYFSDCVREIREDFQFIRPLDGNNLKVLNRIVKTESVSIHIRRGDYVTDRNTNMFHGVCPPGYYSKAITHINKTIIKPEYFIFSDDRQWAKNNLKLNKATYIDWNHGPDSYIDMQLMSNCKHNIIANSSFSWWGAWLNCFPGKIVIAPKKWFNDLKAQEKITELIPEEWTKI